MEQAVIIVTVKNKIPLFKGKDQATSIELIELEEVGYELVSQKDLYKVGDKAVLVQPDYCVSDIPLFESFIRPGGQESKSMLGKVGGLPRRIRAKKFTLSKIAEGEPVYSNGILLPYKEVVKYLNATKKLEEQDLTFLLGITKYEEPEASTLGLAGKGGRDFPSWLYKTDETNINNLWNHLEKVIKYPVVLVGTEKVDGSSITIGRKDMDEYICSRNLVKPFVERKFSHTRHLGFLERIQEFLGKEIDKKVYVESPSTDTFVKVGKPYLDELVDYDNFFLRGELNGASSKGSGNKNNPAAKEELNIKFFGLDYINEAGIAVKATRAQFDTFCLINKLPQVKVVFQKKFKNKAALVKECEAYFKKNLIEGIVIRTVDSQFSAKFMNNFYDSMK